MMKMQQEKEVRKLDVAVISDTHLGIYGSKTKELLRYLKSIDPQTLVLNGDIIDVWQFSKSYFPKSHFKVVRQILKMMEKGTRVHYLVGNHDEVFRRFVGLKMGNFSIDNKLVLEMKGTQTWIFHGDVFDVVMHHSKWLARLGAHGYGLLTLVNKLANFVLKTVGKRRLSLSGKVKDAVKGKKNISSRFEKVVTDLAIRKRYDYVICGHIHRPEVKEAQNAHGKVVYLNSGDWVDHCTALEFYESKWHLKVVGPDLSSKIADDTDADDEHDMEVYSKAHLFKMMYQDIVTS
jgi:UDP-2,3-diacylglucosamine pyrophosphatase LpxH